MHVHPRQVRQLPDVELGRGRVPFHAGAVEDHAVAVDDAEDAVIARLERIEPQRVGLGDVAGGVDLVVEDHEHAFAARRRFGRDAEPLEQVGRSFISQRARIAHRADDDNGLLRADGEIEEIRGLFQRVGAARDDDAGQFLIVVERGIDPSRQVQPLRDRQLRAGDVGELFGFGAHVAIEAGHRFQQLVARQPAAGAVRDGAAGGDEQDLRKPRDGVGVHVAARWGRRLPAVQHRRPLYQDQTERQQRERKFHVPIIYLLPANRESRLFHSFVTDFADTRAGRPRSSSRLRLARSHC